MYSSLPDKILVRFNRPSNSEKLEIMKKTFEIQVNKYCVESVISLVTFILREIELLPHDEEFKGATPKIYSKEGVELNDDDLYFSLENMAVVYIDLDGRPFNYGQILDQYEVIEKLGQGGFGSVYKVKHTETGKILAMKTLQTEEYTSRADQAEELFREQKTLKQLDHQHIIKLYHAFKVPNQICLLMEYADSGELERYLLHKSGYKVPEAEARYFILQICRAISF